VLSAATWLREAGPSVSQFRPADLARRRLGQIRRELDDARVLVGRRLLLDVLLELGGEPVAGREAVAEHHDRAHDGAALPVGGGDRRRLGDRVTEDEAGFLHVERRADDVSISAGYRIGPFEVESALVAHPAVAEAAVVAAPDEERGSVVRAIVVLRDGHEASDALARELQDHVKAETAPYKYPRIVEFADALPRTASGKVRRAELRTTGG
jgi:acetyl-CoA synthetase